MCVAWHKHTWHVELHLQWLCYIWGVGELRQSARSAVKYFQQLCICQKEIGTGDSRHIISSFHPSNYTAMCFRALVINLKGVFWSQRDICIIIPILFCAVWKKFLNDFFFFYSFSSTFVILPLNTISFLLTSLLYYAISL